MSGARLLGVLLDTCMIEAFEGFLEELTKWNQRMNLTALRDDRSIIVRHFLDSLTLVRHLPKGSSVLDIGSGAGFPGIPLGIVRSDLEIVLLEASRKKTYFHRKVIRSLNLSGIESIWGRSDQAETDFVRPEGRIVVMVGENVDVPCLPPSLDLHLDNTVSLDLPFDRTRRHLLFFRK
jgi:16S rRNA (guanine527-N7)-methyltransferase